MFRGHQASPGYPVGWGWWRSGSTSSTRRSRVARGRCVRACATRRRRRKARAARCSRAWTTTSRWSSSHAPRTRCSRGTRHSATSPARTETMTLGLLVTGVTYRYPGLLAKIVTTLDVLSGGRAMLGIGAAWYEREHVAPRRPVLSDRGAARAARGDAPDLPADVERRRRAVRGEALPARRDAERAAVDPAAASADHDRGRRRAEAAAARREVRGCEQPLPYLDRARCSTSSTCSHATARRSAATGRRSATRRSAPLASTPTSTAFVAEMAQYAALGFEHVQLGLLGDRARAARRERRREDRAAPRRALGSSPKHSTILGRLQE